MKMMAKATVGTHISVILLLFFVVACTGPAQPAPEPTATPKPPALPTATAAVEPEPEVADEVDQALLHILATYAGVDAVASLGTHGLEQSLGAMSDASEIGPRMAGEIRNVLAVIDAVAWPPELMSEVRSVQENLVALHDALVGMDLAAAQAAAHEAHEADHDFAAAAYAWLDQQVAGHTGGEVGVLNVYTGLDALATLGTHGLEQNLEAMSDAGEIGPRTAGNVRNTLVVINAIHCPEELSAEVTAVRESLKTLYDYLVAADLAGAQAAAREAHEADHDLSVAAYDWLGQQVVGHASGELAVLGIYAGLDAISSLGTHSLEESLEAMSHAGEISPRTAGNVRNTLAVISAVPWPQELAAEVLHLQEKLVALNDALVVADLAGAQLAAHEAHEADHDLAVAAYDWLKQQTVVASP